MLYVCDACGAWCEPLLVDADERVCPRCHARRRFRRLPLLVVTGSSAAGKSAVAARLPALLPTCVVLDQDVLWKDEFIGEVTALEAYRRTWLRLGMNIAQGGRSLVLLGTALPQHYETLPERALFSRIHYLALVTEDDELERRLHLRPSWRRSAGETAKAMLAFNGWLRENAATTTPAVDLLDTTQLPWTRRAGRSPSGRGRDSSRRNVPLEKGAQTLPLHTPGRSGTWRTRWVPCRVSAGKASSGRRLPLRACWFTYESRCHVQGRAHAL